MNVKGRSTISMCSGIPKNFPYFILVSSTLYYVCVQVMYICVCKFCPPSKSNTGSIIDYMSTLVISYNKYIAIATQPKINK